MKNLFKNIIWCLILTLFFNISLTAQVGINTQTPEGALDVSSTNAGVIVPRVKNIFGVVSRNGIPAVDGTIVYDTAQEAFCFRVDQRWSCMTINDDDKVVHNPAPIDDPCDPEFANYVKANFPSDGDQFGRYVSLSGDGNTLAISAISEDSNATGINGNQDDNSRVNSGAVFVFVKDGCGWNFEAYIKADHPDVSDSFGFFVTLSKDGNTLAIGAHSEDSNATGINGDETNNSASSSGAAYIYTRSGSIWTKQAYLKASNTQAGDNFGVHGVLSDDGNTLVVTATGEDSASSGINGNQLNNGAGNSGAAYVFRRVGVVWTQEAYIKSGDPDSNDNFVNCTLSGDGNTLAIGASFEDGGSAGINGNQFDNSILGSGAVYVYVYNGSAWSQQAYIKASNPGTHDNFGSSVAISEDGNTLVVGAPDEDSNATGINGNQLDNSASNSGALYVFNRSGTTWSQQAYIKASNTNADDDFGFIESLDLSDDGNTIAVGAPREDSNALGFNGDDTDNSRENSGATYIFKRNVSVWTQTHYIKPTIISDEDDNFSFAGVRLSGDGSMLIVGSPNEDGLCGGIDATPYDNSGNSAGAVYVYKL